ncbi:MAG: hypothetical protein IIA90_00055 [Chloroflexi bacterium]|nr:hypothetical protein [Chloroflexota bacterium]
MHKLLIALALVAVTSFALGSAGLMIASEGDRPPPVGDVNCDSSVDPIDALMILRFDAGLDTGIPQGCPAIGDGMHAVASAIGDLAIRLGVAPKSIAVLQIRQVEWPDPCLGVYEDGLCLAIPVSGYWILFGAAGEDYDYRTDCFGEVIIATDFADPNAEVSPPPEESPGACG